MRRTSDSSADQWGRDCGRSGLSASESRAGAEVRIASRLKAICPSKYIAWESRNCKEIRVIYNYFWVVDEMDRAVSELL
jgi:hypothetical protein